MVTKIVEETSFKFFFLFFACGCTFGNKRRAIWSARLQIIQDTFMKLNSHNNDSEGANMAEDSHSSCMITVKLRAASIKQGTATIMTVKVQTWLVHGRRRSQLMHAQCQAASCKHQARNSHNNDSEGANMARAWQKTVTTHACSLSSCELQAGGTVSGEVGQLQAPNLSCNPIIAAS